MEPSATDKTRQCIKCKHINLGATMTDVEACPSCGAIYSRVEAYMASDRAGSQRKPNDKPEFVASRFSSATHTKHVPVDQDFVIVMRENSLYPVFRQLINIGTWLIYIFAALILIGSLFSKDVKIIISAIIGATFLVVFAKVVKEASLMVADLADATVIQASRQARS